MTVDSSQWTEAQMTDAYRREHLRLEKIQAEAAKGTRTAVTVLMWLGIVLVALQFLAVFVSMF